MHDGSFLGMFGSDTRVMGRFSGFCMVRFCALGKTFIPILSALLKDMEVQLCYLLLLKKNS